MAPVTVELCAGAGGQALGLEMAGLEHSALFENDKAACATLRKNRPQWNVVEHDLFQSFNWSQFKGIDLLAGGLPCPPFSVAGKQLGEGDDRNLFNVGIELVDQLQPSAVMFENVKGLLEPRFAEYRQTIDRQLEKLGYKPQWKLLHSSDFGVPQLRPRVLLVAIRKFAADRFEWPSERDKLSPRTVGETLEGLMSANGWRGASQWKKMANRIAPTVVGGSKKHGGPDLGPTRARKAWAELGVNGIGIANAPPEADFVGMPKLTVPMVARLQGFPAEWEFIGGKTASYRQVGNAFPPPVAAAVARKIVHAVSIKGFVNLAAAE
jgi:DNA (cytosine-5)-methyltransferase 1